MEVTTTGNPADMGEGEGDGEGNGTTPTGGDGGGAGGNGDGDGGGGSGGDGGGGDGGGVISWAVLKHVAAHGPAVSLLDSTGNVPPGPATRYIGGAVWSEL